MMNIYAGIDAGSRAIKIVLLDAAGVVLARAIADQGAAQESLIHRLFAEMLAAHGLSRDAVAGVVATGYARNLVGMTRTTRTEITCHARGVLHLAPGTRTIIEVGGQDSKLLRLTPQGGVADFAMNDRCAAGSGRFLETVAQRLEMPINTLGALAAASHSPVTITSTCAVFAESEIIGLLAAGVLPADIAAGVQSAVARRVATLAQGRIELPLLFTGGVALVAGMPERLAAALDCLLYLAPDPQYTGALGAALLAREGQGGEL